MERLFGEALIKVPEGRAPNDSHHQWFRLVTPRIDKYKTVILPEGIDLSTHRSNPVFLWMHSGGKDDTGRSPEPQVVIGRVIEYQQSRQNLDIFVEWDVADAPERDLPDQTFARACSSKVQRGFLKGASIGFEPREIRDEQVRDDITAALWGVPVGSMAKVIASAEMMEASLVIIPANSQTLALARSLDAEDEEAFSSIITERAIRAGFDPEEIVGLLHGSVTEMEARAAGFKGKAVAYKKYGLDDSPWDADKEEAVWRKFCSSDSSGNWATVDREKYSEMFAAVLNGGENQGDYKLPHHSVDRGTGHLLTNKHGVAAAIGAINGARGGVSLPAAVKKAALAHLKKHQKEIDDADKEKAASVTSPAAQAGQGGASDERAVTVANRSPGTQVDLPGTPGSSASTDATAAPAVTTTLPPAATPGNGSQAPHGSGDQGARGMGKRMLNPAHTYAARSLIGDHMRTAAGHMHCMSHCSAPELKPMHDFHKESAQRSVEHASTLAGHIRDFGDEDGDDDSMRSGKLSQARAITDDKIGTPELRAKFNEVAVAVLKFDMRGLSEITERALGTAKIEEASGKLDSLLTKEGLYSQMVKNARTNRDDAFAAERTKIVSELSTAGYMSPHMVERALGKIAGEEPWSLTRLGAYKADVLREAPLVELQRVAPIVAAPGALPPGFAPAPLPPAVPPASQALTPPAPAPAPGSGGGEDSGAVRAAKDFATRAGLDPVRAGMTARKKEAEAFGNGDQVRAIAKQIVEYDAEKQRAASASATR